MIKFKKISLIAFISILSGFHYLYLQAHFENQGHLGSYTAHPDENSYNARIQRAKQKQASLCSPWTIKNANLPCMVPAAPERIIAFLLNVLDWDLEAASPYLRFIFVTLSSYILIFIGEILGLNLAFSLALPPALFLSASSWFLRPYLSLFSTSYYLNFNRFINPLFPLVFFFLATYFFLLWRVKKNIYIWSVTILSIAFLFYISFYYWSHLGLWILFLMIYDTFKNKLNFKNYILLGLGICALALPWILSFIKIQNHPLNQIVMWRSGINTPGDLNYLIYNSTTYIIYALLAVLVIKISTELSFGVLSGIFCFYLPLIMRKELQSFHYKYTLIPLSLILIFFLFQHLLNCQAKWKNIKLHYIIPSLLIFLPFIEFHKNIKYFDFPSEFNLQKNDRGLSLAINRLKSLPTMSILSSAKTMYFIPAKSSQRIFLESAIEFVPNAELMWSRFLIWRLENKSAEDIAKIINPPVPMPIALWSHGLNDEMFNKIFNGEFKIITEENRTQLTHFITALYQESSDEEINNRTLEHQINIILISPREEFQMEKINQFFKIIKVENFLDTKLYYVERKTTISL